MAFPSFSSPNSFLSDRWFYALSALLAGGLIFLALEPFTDHKPSGPMSAAGADALNLTIDGDNLYRFQAGKVGEIALNEETDGVMLRISLEAREAYDTPLYGPHLPLDADIERNYEGRPARITITARSNDQFQASAFEANYTTGSKGESGRISFKLSRDWQDYSFEFDVPRADSGLGNDFIAIRPVVPEKHRTMDVKAIHLKSLGPKRD